MNPNKSMVVHDEKSLKARREGLCWGSLRSPPTYIKMGSDLWRIFLVVVFLIHPCGMIAVSVAAESVTMSMRLSPCPDSPNCVSSDATDPSHRVDAFEIIIPVQAAWVLVHQAARDLPRAKIKEISDRYLHIECTSAVFQFVDDLELELRAGEGIIAVRSASRRGYWDFGVNRRRVERLREALRSRGVVK